MIVATLWGYFFLPETKGLTMDQMDVILYVALAWTQHFSETMLTFLLTVAMPMMLALSLPPSSSTPHSMTTRQNQANTRKLSRERRLVILEVVKC